MAGDFTRSGQMYLYIGLAALAALATHAALAASSFTIIQQEKKFSQQEITIARGDSVVFKNEDPFTHNVYSQSPGMSFDLKVQKAGESSAVVFDRAGSGEIRCAIHPQMKLKLTVK
jgi:plastocyanin